MTEVPKEWNGTPEEWNAVVEAFGRIAKAIQKAGRQIVNSFLRQQSIRDRKKQLERKPEAAAVDSSKYGQV